MKIYRLRSHRGYFPINYSGNPRLVMKYLSYRYLADKDYDPDIYGTGLYLDESRVYEIDDRKLRFDHYLMLIVDLTPPFPMAVFPNNVYPLVQLKHFKSRLPNIWQGYMLHVTKKYRIKLGSKRWGDENQ